MFRHFQLELGRVELGKPLPYAVAAAAGEPDGDGVIVLPAGTFAGAERITLYLTPSRVLAGARFEYAGNLAFEERVESYAAMGVPTRERAEHGAAHGTEVVSWQDEATAFRLIRAPNGNGWVVWAELWDRHLAPGGLVAR